MQHRALPPPNAPASAPPGWYRDPFAIVPWRWWDGHRWTHFTHGGVSNKPRLPRWLSVPVLIAAPLVLVALVIFLVVSPISVLAAAVPLFIVLPTLWWLDRVEPEPLGSRIHAVLWGAAVAVLVSAIVNTVVELASSANIAAVLSAPIIEEAMKGLGVVWAFRRREIDGVTDGIVFAGWIALGFAVVEDVLYFAMADEFNSLLEVFILRAVLTPFVHPLFTLWIGLAIGLEVRAGRGLSPRALWGYAVAVALHMAWNGSLVWFGETNETDDIGAVMLLVAVVFFVALFFAVVVALIVMRRRERREFAAAAPFLAGRYGLTPVEQEWFLDWATMLRWRRQLGRKQRRCFDDVRASLARLALFHQRGDWNDTESEQVLMQQLHEARRELAAKR